MKAVNKPHILAMEILEELLNACSQEYSRLGQKKNAIVHIANLMEIIGMSIGKDTFLEIIFDVISSRSNSKDYIKSIVKFLDGILKSNETLLKLTSGNTIDPARLHQADINIKDSVFVKMKKYI